MADVMEAGHASAWGESAERKAVRPALVDSYESVFHTTGVARFLLELRRKNEATVGLRPERLERAIGVIYLPRTERISHYFHAVLPAQFDFLIHVDQTRAVEPLERTALWDRKELAETFPHAV